MGNIGLGLNAKNRKNTSTKIPFFFALFPLGKTHAKNDPAPEESWVDRVAPYRKWAPRKNMGKCSGNFHLKFWATLPQKTLINQPQNNPWFPPNWVLKSIFFFGTRFPREGKPKLRPLGPKLTTGNLIKAGGPIGRFVFPKSIFPPGPMEKPTAVKILPHIPWGFTHQSHKNKSPEKILNWQRKP